MSQGIVAIVGRPNVGKSTIFNRLTRTNKAIVDDQPGVTRDRLYGTVPSNDEERPGFTVIDTGGFESETVYYQPFEDNLVWEQTKFAIDSADVVLMVFDAKAGLHPHDQHLVQYLKKLNKEVIYLVNKVDAAQEQSAAWEFFRLGIDEPMKASAAHNRGLWEVVDALEEKLDNLPKARASKTQTERATRIALIGRPNAGKSSILNRLIGESRAVVSDVAGTTRDSLDTPMTFNHKPYVIIDTAGIRRRSKVKERVESLSVMRSLRVIDEADIVVLVVTPENVMCDQDAKLVQLAVNQSKPVLVVVNKWDLVPDKDAHSAKKFTDYIREKLKDIPYIPVLFVSCLENLRVHKIMGEVESLATYYQKRVPTSRINEVLEQSVQRHTPALIRNHTKRVKFYYATQVRTAPPTIVVKCNVADEIQESYKRYLSHRFREALDFGPIPIRIIYRGKNEKREGGTPVSHQRHNPSEDGMESVL